MPVKLNVNGFKKKFLAICILTKLGKKQYQLISCIWVGTSIVLIKKWS